MSLIPEIVRQRLEQLALDPEAIQAPNFCAGDLMFHQPPALPGEPSRGIWSLDGCEFTFSLIGQLSAHHTFLGEHGDLSSLHSNVGGPPFGALMKAKWKMTVVLPSSLEDSPTGLALKKQFDILKAIQEANIANSPLQKGTVLGGSFIYASKHGLRASALSDSIFRTAVEPGDSVVAAASWPDPAGTFVNLVDDRKASLMVKPINLFDPKDTAVPFADALKVFAPGSWVQIVCSLKMWDTSDVANLRGRGQKRAPLRSFQVTLEAAQKLCDGRLDEGALQTKPAARKLKRPFSAVDAAPNEAERVGKERRISVSSHDDDVMLS